VLLTWFHQGRRDVLQLHPRWDADAPLTGVFTTRSPDRPNPVGLHRVRVIEVDRNRLRVAPLEAMDGTPVIDIKPVLSESADW
jgi:tRNA-Thr(GGU) m(6)t(6)A37 methyltransferase TsaA